MTAEIDRLINIKAELLCNGVKSTPQAFRLYHEQNPAKINKSGLVGLHFLLNGQVPVLTSTTYRFDQQSRLMVTKDQKNGFRVQSTSGLLIPITPISMPSWYSEKTTSDKPMNSILAHEGTNFLHMQYSGCDFQVAHKGCKFCATGTEWISNTPEEIAETALRAFSGNDKYQLCLGGGTKLPLGSNVRFFTETAKLIRKSNSQMPIWVEMIPPTNDQIEEMIEAGVTAFGFNLEAWSEEARNRICPGKSQVSTARYIEAMKFVRGKLGLNCINTALITGLEADKHTLEGIHALSSEGIEITLLPFRPWDKSELSGVSSSDPVKLLSRSITLAKEMRDNKINPEDHYGCAKCQSCTLPFTY